jgi:hypothetical protein
MDVKQELCEVLKKAEGLGWLKAKGVDKLHPECYQQKVAELERARERLEKRIRPDNVYNRDG